MATETIIAVYDTPAHAELAIADLEAGGIPTSSIQHYTRDQYHTETYDPARTETGAKSEGLWGWLFGETSEEHHQDAHHRAAYDQAFQGGSTVVTVVAEQAHADKIVAILEQHAPIDIEERASQAPMAGGAGYAQSQSAGYGDSQVAGYTAAPTAGYATSQHSTGTTAERDLTARQGEAGLGTKTGEEVIALSEESLQVGKREIDRGTTRVRRYVVERPVEEQIRLRDERVSVFRRPVTDGTVGAGAFTDKVVEVRETAEEAVVGKTARVVEEVVVQKGVEERSETIRDTLRREEVEITGPHGTAGETGVTSRVG